MTDDSFDLVWTPNTQEDWDKLDAIRRGDGETSVTFRVNWDWDVDDWRYTHVVPAVNYSSNDQPQEGETS